MKFCMECGQKAPPAAKFCPGCGNSMSLSSAAGVDDNEKIARAPNHQFKGLTTEELAKKLAQVNRSDGSKEA